MNNILSCLYSKCKKKHARNTERYLTTLDFWHILSAKVIFFYSKCYKYAKCKLTFFKVDSFNGKITIKYILSASPPL